MSPDRLNLKLAKDLWIAASTGDAGRLRELLSPDVQWTSVGADQLSSVVVGADAAIGRLMSVAADASDLSDADIYVSERGAVLRCRTGGGTSGVSDGAEQLLRIRVNEGRIVEGIAVPVNSA